MANPLQTIESQALEVASQGSASPLPADISAGGPDAGAFLPTPDPLAGGFTRATDPLNPAEDPRFQEFLRRQGASGARARQAIAKRIADLEKGRDRRLEDLGIREERGIRDIAGDFEQRGLFGSGRMLRTQGEFGGDIERDRSRFLEDLQEQFADLEQRRSRIGAGSGRRRQEMLEQIRRDLALEMARSGIVPNFGGNPLQIPGSAPRRQTGSSGIR